MAASLSRAEVLADSQRLPASPGIVARLLAALDDPDSNQNRLVRHLGRDPVLAARVLAQAAAVSGRARRDARAADLYAALSVLGFAGLRRIAATAAVADADDPVLRRFWTHSAAAGVCAQQLALHVRQAPEPALIAGLLHDVGQLWLAWCRPEAFHAARRRLADGVPVEQAERDLLGVDHAQIGAWLAESWHLPPPLCAAIRAHHAPDGLLGEPLVPLVHVAEVLSNALDLGGNGRVGYLSPGACAALGLDWDARVLPLFGRIDAMSQFLLHDFAASP